MVSGVGGLVGGGERWLVSSGKVGQNPISTLKVSICQSIDGTKE